MVPRVAPTDERSGLALLLDAVSDSVVLFDQAWRYAYANARALRYLGASREQVTGTVLWDRFPQLRDTEFGRACVRVAATGIAEHVESFDEVTSKLFASDIQRTPVGVAVVARDVTAPRAVGVTTNVRDVTADPEAEQRRLRKAARDAAFVQATSVLLWVTDPYGHVPEDSPTWRALTGLSFDDLMTPWGWAKALHPDDRERVAAAWSSATRSKSLFVCEQRFRRRDGTYVWTLARAAPVLDERGDIVEWVGTNMDISESKRAEEEREAALRFAEQFIGILSHDLRNPITAIQMATQLLGRKAEREGDRQRLVERIAASTSRMSNMVAQLLDLTRVRLGTGLGIERNAIDLSHVVTAAIEELRLVYPTRIVECACEAAVQGSWDGDRLAQVVSNLVGNALQHGDPLRPVEVKLATVESAAVFEVKSYGPPIPPDLLPHIFDPYRHGEPRRGKSQGLGLGLFITHEIVRAHGGRIDVHSAVAEGTRFIVTLPLG